MGGSLTYTDGWDFLRVQNVCAPSNHHAKTARHMTCNHPDKNMQRIGAVNAKNTHRWLSEWRGPYIVTIEPCCFGVGTADHSLPMMGRREGGTWGRKMAHPWPLTYPSGRGRQRSRPGRWAGRNRWRRPPGYGRPPGWTGAAATVTGVCVCVCVWRYMLMYSQPHPSGITYRQWGRRACMENSATQVLWMTQGTIEGTAAFTASEELCKTVISYTINTCI